MKKFMYGFLICLMFFFQIPNDISSAAIATISKHRDYLRVTRLTTNTISLNYNAIFDNRASNNSLNSNLKKHKKP